MKDKTARKKQKSRKVKKAVAGKSWAELLLPKLDEKYTGKFVDPKAEVEDPDEFEEFGEGTYKMTFSHKGMDPIAIFRNAMFINPNDRKDDIDYWDDEKAMATALRYIERQCYTATHIAGEYKIPYSRLDTVDFRKEYISAFFVNEGSFSNYLKACNAVCNIKFAIIWLLFGGEDQDILIQRKLHKGDFAQKFSMELLLDLIPNDGSKWLFAKFLGTIMRGKFSISLREIPWLLCRTLAAVFVSSYRDKLRCEITRQRAANRNAYDIYAGTYVRGRKPKYRPIHKTVIRLTKEEIKIWTNFYRPKRMQKTIDLCLKRLRKASVDTRFVGLSIKRVFTSEIVDPLVPHPIVFE